MSVCLTVGKIIGSMQGKSGSAVGGNLGLVRSMCGCVVWG